MTTLALLSDQHGRLPTIPPCDILVIAGDMCGGPSHEDGRWRPDLSDERWMTWLGAEFKDWIAMAPCAVVVAGNHDTAIERYGPPNLPSSVSYLCDSGCEVLGLRFWGCPWIKRFDDLAFNRMEDKLDSHYGIIPDGVDVIISHGPPLLYGDRLGVRNLGSESLLRAVNRLSPRLVVCGHIHEARGVYKHQSTKIVNTAGEFTMVEL